VVGAMVIGSWKLRALTAATVVAGARVAAAPGAGVGAAAAGVETEVTAVEVAAAAWGVATAVPVALPGGNRPAPHPDGPAKVVAADSSSKRMKTTLVWRMG
jgi:hypothetical protein